MLPITCFTRRRPDLRVSLFSLRCRSPSRLRLALLAPLDRLSALDTRFGNFVRPGLQLLLATRRLFGLLSIRDRQSLTICVEGSSRSWSPTES